MKNSSTDQRLAAELARAPLDTLWLADESALATAAPKDIAGLVSNRWDVYTQAACAGRWFSDWALAPALTARRYQRVVYRVSKERAVVHHLLNQLAEHWQQWDSLILIGQKNEGLKSYAEHAGQLFGNKAVKKHGNDYVAEFAAAAPSAPPLDCQQYTALREICQWQGTPLYSKPGTFGWQKVDDGSQFLLAQLPAVAAQLATPPSRILDLGCGYGFVSLAARQLLARSDITWLATDNCAAALAAFQHNCGSWADGFAGDRGLGADGQPLRDPVDLVLCNPPFHQGFSPSGDITEKFVAAMQRWLRPSGTALVVVNQFVGLEKKSQGLFKSCRVLANNGSFKVIALDR